MWQCSLLHHRPVTRSQHDHLPYRTGRVHRVPCYTRLTPPMETDWKLDHAWQRMYWWEWVYRKETSECTRTHTSGYSDIIDVSLWYTLQWPLYVLLFSMRLLSILRVALHHLSLLTKQTMTTWQITPVYEIKVLLTVSVHSTVHSCRQCTITEMNRPWFRVFPYMYISQRDMYPCHSEFHVYFYPSADQPLVETRVPAMYLLIIFATSDFFSSLPTFWGWPRYNAIVP